MLPPGKNDLFLEKQPFPLDISLHLMQKIQGNKQNKKNKKRFSRKYKRYEIII